MLEPLICGDKDQVVHESCCGQEPICGILMRQVHETALNSNLVVERGFSKRDSSLDVAYPGGRIGI